MNIAGAVSGAAEAAKQAAIEAAKRAAAEAAKKAAAEAAAKLAAAEAAKKAAAEAAKPAGDAAAAAGQDLGKAAQAMAAQADPLAAIQQADGKATCAAANKQMAMQQHNPEVYQQVVQSLREEGSAKMPNGQQIHLSEKNREYIDRQPGSEADKDNLRVQAALMDYANQTEDYDMEKDLSVGEDGIAHQGLNEEQMMRLDALDETTTTASAGAVNLRATVTSAFSNMNPWGGGGVSRDEALADQIARDVYTAAADGQALAIALEVSGGDKHAFTVVGVNDKTDTVTVRDTNGEQVLSQEAFDAAVNGTEGDIGEEGGGVVTSGSIGRRR